MRPQGVNLLELAGPLLAMAVALVVLVALVLWFRSWLRENEDPAESTHELLVHSREMLREGELSDEEFRLIKGRLVAHLGQAAPAHRKTSSND